MSPLIKFQPIAAIILLLAIFTHSPSRFVFENLTYSKSVELKDLKNLHADIKINAGTLHLSTNTGSKADFNSSFSKNNWRAEIKLDQKSNRLIIHQPEEDNMNMKDEDKNDWKIKIPKVLSTNLKLTMGAGEGIIDLSGSKLTKMDLEAGAGNFEVNLSNTPLSDLEVNAGVGALSVDLSGSKTNDVKAEINGGIGEVKLILPKDAGIRIKAHGFGDIKNNTLKKQGGYYVNNLYGKGGKKVEVEVNGGLGSLELTVK
jgi:hypothetical protein